MLDLAMMRSLRSAERTVSDETEARRTTSRSVTRQEDVMASRWIAQFSLVAVIVVVAISQTIGQEGSGAEGRRRGRISTHPASTELAWPTPAALKAYDSVDG